MAPLPGVLGKVEAAVERTYAPIAHPARPDVRANITANDVREDRERDAKTADTKKEIMKVLRVAKALLALEQTHFRRAGSELAELLEEDGLGEKEGEVSSESLLVPWEQAWVCRAEIGDRRYQRVTWH